MKGGYVLKRLAKKYFSDEIGRFSASLSYYMIFSLFPLLILTSIFIARIGIDPQSVEKFLRGIVPGKIAALVRNYLVYASNYGGLQMLVISGFFTIYFPVRFIENLMEGINRAYGIKNNRRFLKKHAIILLFVLLVYFMFFITFMTVVSGRNVFFAILSLLGISAEAIDVWRDTRIVILLLSAFLSVTLLYYIAPCIKLKIKDILPGSAGATVIWLAVSAIFSYYAENMANYSLLYGSIAVVMMLLYWLFITALILLMGAEFNSVLYENHR